MSEVQWEAEFFSLQDNNNKLVAALHEANANVDQWKKQLTAYQEETETLRQRVSSGGNPSPDSALGPLLPSNPANPGCCMSLAGKSCQGMRSWDWGAPLCSVC